MLNLAFFGHKSARLQICKKKLYADISNGLTMKWQTKVILKYVPVQNILNY